MRTGRRMLTALASALVLTGGMTFAASSAVLADSPADLEPGYVTDRSGVLTDAAEERLEQRLDELASADGLPELYVILVPRFESPSNALTWADRTAQRNNLASDQYLLAIATEGRALAISAEYGGEGTAAGPLSESRVLEIENRLGGDYLSDDDWEGGIAFVADEFSEVPLPWWVWVLGLAALALVIFGITRLVRFLQHRAALAAERRTLEGQQRQAARRLVQTDEAVRTSEQELGFVTAEFGEQTTEEFAEVLTRSRRRLEEAFGLLEKLQDAEKDTLDETRVWTKDIGRVCAQIDRDLNDHRSRLASLRALADDAPKTIARLKTARERAGKTQVDTAERLDALAAAVPAADLVGVSGNAEEIARHLAEADAQLAKLERAAQARRPRAISDAVHEIERLLAEVDDLRDAVVAHADALGARALVSGAGAVTVGGSVSEETVLARAAAAVRAAESSVRARPGQVGALALTRLRLAQRTLASAQASVDPVEAHRLAATASDVAGQVRSLIAPSSGAAATAGATAAAASASAAPDEPLMYGPKPTDPVRRAMRPPAPSIRVEEGPSLASKGIWGGVVGGGAGFIGALGLAEETPGMLVVGLVVGALFGALSNMFDWNGGSSGGSSSGWGGSSSRRSGSSSRSSFRSSSRSSGRRSSSSRSSGRSGGRRF